MVNWAILPQLAHAPPFAAHPQGRRTGIGKRRQALSPNPLPVTTLDRLIGYDQAAANGRDHGHDQSLAIGSLMEEDEDWTAWQTLHCIAWDRMSFASSYFGA